MGVRDQRTYDYNARSNPDALFDVPVAGAALDRYSRRFESTHDFFARQTVGDDVSPLLSRCPGSLAGRLNTGCDPALPASAPSQYSMIDLASWLGSRGRLRGHLGGPLHTVTA